MVATLDLFYLFVENVFGNFLFAVIGLTTLLALMCMSGRMSLMLTFTIVSLFLASMLIGFFGSIIAIMFFAMTFIYFTWNFAALFKGGM